MRSNLPHRSKQLLWRFFFSKTPRERFLLCAALILCVGYCVMDFIYAPLLAQHHALYELRTHTLQQLNLSLDSLHNSTQLAHQEQQSLQDTQRLNTLLHTHLTLYPAPKPLLLIPSVIESAKANQLTLLSLEPSPATSSLNIEGYGGFEDFKTLLDSLESHHFLSLDSLALSPRTPHSVNFAFTLVSHIPDTLEL